MAALSGIRVIEMAGLAPVPMAAMILADFGADVIRVDKPHLMQTYPATMTRGKRSIVVNMQSEDGVQIIRKLCRSSDVLIEPFRPGVMEKIGLGPNVLMTDNPRLIYTRLTGYGQKGPLSSIAGHDINYVAMSGVLSCLGRPSEKPSFPASLLADMGGGAMSTVIGILLALHHRERQGQGQVINADMVSGTAYLASILWMERTLPSIWGTPNGRGAERGKGWFSGATHFYDTYETSDGEFMAVGALEPQFYMKLVEGLGLTEEEAPQFGGDDEQIKERITRIFASRTRAEWCEVFDGVDACVTPVLSKDEAATHAQGLGGFCPGTGPHPFARGMCPGLGQPKAAPHLERTPAGSPCFRMPVIGEHTKEVLSELGYDETEIESLISAEKVSSKL